MSTYKKVLIAEDSSVIQNLTKKILEFQNYKISSVKNGKDVLKAVESENYDIILMDINMPLMDGMTCAKEIRKNPDAIKAKVPIVAITGNAKNYSDKDFVDAGINEYLQKPLDFDKLVETVKKWTL
ncbi:histidine kinase [Sporocytophaga myxococcoides]|uniref:Histidine kinase n=1 Tax=Sporocytophaga myxococcoides TaxID=153721 RepID=A0A098LAT2_9BACT|nr:response regulator [Sporocytophaga myxococcoides]GAL83258.1 histidine kinase [Sporocytophaga myxococcoides]